MISSLVTVTSEGKDPELTSGFTDLQVMIMSAVFVLVDYTSHMQ